MCFGMNAYHNLPSGSGGMCDPQQSNLNPSIQQHPVLPCDNKKDNTNVSFVSSSFFSHMVWTHTQHKKTLSFRTPNLRFSHSYFRFFFFFTDVSKKSRSSFHPPVHPQSEKSTDWFHELWGRRRRSPSRLGSCDRLRQSHAWQSSQTSGRGHRHQDPLRLGSNNIEKEQKADENYVQKSLSKPLAIPCNDSIIKPYSNNKEITFM